MMVHTVLISACFLLLPLVRGQEPDCFCLEEIPAATGLRNPTNVVTPPDGSGRMFISEQIGTVRIIDNNGNLLPEPFFDISDLVASLGDRGFLSMTFHPDFVNNRKLYIHYTWFNDTVLYMRLSELQASEVDPNVADMNTERFIIDLVQFGGSHHGGGILFGSDGYLYVGEGDGSNPGDPLKLGQNMSVLHGKILRIDVNVGTGPYEYGIPPDNPFVDQPGVPDEIYASGIRNPFRMTMDRGNQNSGDGYGRIFIGDVGDTMWEEVDILEAGGNYAWSCKEGFEDYDMSQCEGGVVPDEVLPILTYDHIDVGQCVIGGYVYRGVQNPVFDSWYIFADYAQAKLFRMIEPSPAQYDWKEIFPCSTSCEPPLSTELGLYVLAFGEDVDGEIYITSTNTYSATETDGQVFRVVQDPFAL